MQVVPTLQQYIPFVLFAVNSTLATLFSPSHGLLFLAEYHLQIQNMQNQHRIG